MFTYSGDPSNSDRDHVRFLIQDTDSEDVLLQDAEIDFFVSNEPSILDAAARCAETIAAQFTRKADRVSAEEVSIEYENQADRYYQLAKSFEEREAKTGTGIGRLDDGDVLTAQDTDSQFEVGQFDIDEKF